ncbi:MAG: hypothetical protein OXN17_13810 [Candidatus Poribacteria bacterium]|nr:hypothetical protein [Candidatus Poribacteria bacterium]MDE0506370.1 hypothetical protein [Candidatus Poribacteria bacterium]
MNARVALILAFLTIFCSCGRSITRVTIPIQVESEIDADRFSSFAVLPFVKDNAGDMSDSIDIGNDIASTMRRRIGKHKNYNVVGSQETNRLITGETIDSEFLANMGQLTRLGGHFEVDGLITGSYRYYTINQPKTYYGEHYSPTRRQYVMDYQDYIQRMYILALRVMIVDVDSEEIMWDEKYERTAVENHALGSFLVSQITPRDTILKSLTKQAVSEFTRQIAPHYETEVRFLVK